MTRKDIFTIIEKDDGSNYWSHIYDVFMFGCIILSVVPLMFWDEYPIFRWIELFTTTVFIIDYILRWGTADYNLGKGTHSFVVYPFSFWAIVDLLSILPSFSILGSDFKLLRTTRMLKILRIAKALRYSSQLFLFVDVLKKERKILTTVMFFAIAYIFVTALIMFNFEPRINPNSGEETFHSFFDALYWATVTLTTVGYGDLCPATDLGRFVSMLSSIFGVAIIALPSGIITASYLDELRAIKEEKEEEKKNKIYAALHKNFRRTAQVASWYYDENNKKKCYKCVDRFQSLTSLKVKMRMGEDRLVEMIDSCPDLRLANTATTFSSEEKQQDRLVVVNFPLNTEYGCCVDRGSDVTIVAPSALTEIGTGNAAFSLAAMGGFNYVSRELAFNMEDSLSFYLMNSSKLDLMGDDEAKEYTSSQALHFMHDLAQFKKRSSDRGQRHWFIFIIATTKSEESQVHLLRLANDSKGVLSHRIAGPKREYGSTVVTEDEEKLQQMFQEIHDTLAERNVTIHDEERPIVTQLDNCNLWNGVNDSNIMRRTGGGVDSNSLTIRIAYEILVYHSSHLLIMKDIADAIKKQVEPNRDIPQESVQCFKEEGDGFADNYGEEKIFQRSPQALRRMIQEGNEMALKMFGNSNL
jgi:voltage-gated potassium channel